MNIDYIKEFLVLASTLNYSEASKKLFITQPALSRHISILEKDLGVQLFMRSTHNVSLTETGEFAKESFSKIAEDYNKIISSIETRSFENSGTLKFGIFERVNDPKIWDIYNAFQDSFPEITIEVSSFGVKESLNQIVEGNIDLAPTSSHAKALLPKIKYHPFRKASLAAIMHKSHPLASRASISLDDLKDEALVFINSSSDESISNEWTTTILRKEGFTPKRIVLSCSKETVPYTVKEYNAVHLCRYSISLLRFSDIVEVPIDNLSMKFEMSFAYRDDNRNPALKTFFTFLNRYLKEHPD